MSSIRDIADRAGLSVGTVVRVLNEHADVAGALRERVLVVARALRYVHHPRRKAVKRSATAQRTIGVLLVGMQAGFARLPIIAQALDGVERALAQRGWSMLLAQTASADEVPSFLAASSPAPQGLIVKSPLVGAMPATSALARALAGVPCVWLLGRPAGAVGDVSAYDAGEVGRIAARALHERGHRRVAFINPRAGQTLFDRQRDGFVVESARLGVDAEVIEAHDAADDQWPVPAIATPDRLRPLVARWQRSRRRATALFTPADGIAAQLYIALGERGVAPGRDVAVISCNRESALCAALTPTLASIDIHAEAVGAQAVRLLAHRLDQPLDPVHHQALTVPTLGDGASLGIARPRGRTP